MLDAALIQQCADPSLQPAVVQQFIAKAGSQDPLAVTVRYGNRVVLVPKPKTPEQALALIRDNLGRNTVRVGITQYPAGLGILEAGELKPDMVEPCENIRMGTALFAKVFRIVMKWYGNPKAREVMLQVMDDAVLAWQTGYFEGEAVFRVEDQRQEENDQSQTFDLNEGLGGTGSIKDGIETESNVSEPNRAEIRIDLSRIGGVP